MIIGMNMKIKTRFLFTLGTLAFVLAVAMKPATAQPTSLNTVTKVGAVVTVKINCQNRQYDVYRRDAGSVWSGTKIRNVTDPATALITDTPVPGKMYIYEFYWKVGGVFQPVKSMTVYADVLPLTKSTTLPGSILHDRSGVAVYYDGTNDVQAAADIDKAITNGFRFVRLDLLQFQALAKFTSDVSWPHNWTGKPNFNGAYNFSKWGVLAQKIKDHNTATGDNMELLLTLAGYGENAPKVDQSFETYWGFTRLSAFSRFANESAYYFKSNNYPVRFEVWNEENFGYWWQFNGAQTPNATEYRALLDNAIYGVNAAAAYGNTTTLPVASGGLLYNANSFDSTFSPFIGGVFSTAPSATLSAIGVHPYRWYNGSRPELRETDYNATRAKLNTLGLGAKPIWDTELGYPSSLFNANGDVVRGAGGDPQQTYQNNDGGNANARKAQASYTVRAMLTEWKLGIPMAIIYNMRDRSTNQFDRESTFGLIDANGYYKTAFDAMSTLHSITTNFKLQGEQFITETPQSPTDPNLPYDTAASLPSGANQLATGLHILKTTNPGNNTGQFIVWLDRPNTSVELKFDKNATVYNMLWQLQGTINGTNKFSLNEKDGPIYIQF
jgi:hypothetical protein